jgi:hypothetical protein
MPQRAWIGVDFDGTLAHYNPSDHNRLGPPIPAMIARVQEWIANGTPVKIVTARVASVYAGAPHERIAIENWCYHYLGVRLPVTAEKDFAMRVLYDDRCVQVEPNTGRTMIDLQDEVYRENLAEKDREIDQLRAGLVIEYPYPQEQAEAARLGIPEEEAIPRGETWLHERANWMAEVLHLRAKVTELEARWADQEQNIADQRALRGLTIQDAAALLQEDDWIVTMVKGPIPGTVLQGPFRAVSQDGRHIVLKRPICTVAPENIGLVKRGPEIMCRVIYQHPRYEAQEES